MSHVSSRVALAGEYLAASYLLRYCDSVIPAPEGHKSDLILDHQGFFYRVQVKTTNSIYKRRGKDYYRWEIRTSNRTQDNIRQNKMVRYGNGRIDMFCLVALPINKVFFIPFTEDGNQTEYAKTINNLKKIDSKESLRQSLSVVNETSELNPIDEN